MGGQQKDSISDIVFFQHQDGMRLKVRRHFLQCTTFPIDVLASQATKSAWPESIPGLIKRLQIWTLDLSAGKGNLAKVIRA
jgi:hypothetical protein